MSDEAPERPEKSGWGGYRLGAGRPHGAKNRIQRPQPPKPDPKAPIEIDPEIIERAAGIGCTYAEIAAMCGCSESTLTAHRQRYAELDEAIDRGRANGRATLRRWQWNEAEKGNSTLLIWLGKQHLGQRDKWEHTGEDGRELFPAITVIFGEDTTRPRDDTNGTYDKPGQYGPS